jgi:hypothetical protein
VVGDDVYDAKTDEWKSSVHPSVRDRLVGAIVLNNTGFWSGCDPSTYVRSFLSNNPTNSGLISIINTRLVFVVFSVSRF